MCLEYVKASPTQRITRLPSQLLPRDGLLCFCWFLIQNFTWFLSELMRSAIRSLRIESTTMLPRKYPLKQLQPALIVDLERAWTAARHQAVERYRHCHDIQSWGQKVGSQCHLPTTTSKAVQSAAELQILGPKHPALDSRTCLRPY